MSESNTQLEQCESAPPTPCQNTKPRLCVLNDSGINTPEPESLARGQLPTVGDFLYENRKWIKNLSLPKTFQESWVLNIPGVTAEEPQNLDNLPRRKPRRRVTRSLSWVRKLDRVQ